MWQLGWGSGVTGLTTPVARPTVKESCEEISYNEDMRTFLRLCEEGEEATCPTPPKCQHTVIREGRKTLAIIPTFMEDWGKVGVLMANAANMYVFLGDIFKETKDDALAHKINEFMTQIAKEIENVND